MQDTLIKTIRLQNEIRDREGYFVGYCAELKIYVLSVLVKWATAVYERYYVIDEADFLGYQMNREQFMRKYEKELRQENNCFSERFLGSAALRDYEGTEGFQNYFPANGNPFQGYLYHDGVLFARIVWENETVFVPPVRFLSGGKTDAERRPLRQKCRLMMNQNGEPICFILEEKNG